MSHILHSSKGTAVLERGRKGEALCCVETFARDVLNGAGGNTGKMQGSTLR